jgi:hypothetical protein
MDTSNIANQVPTELSIDQRNESIQREAREKSLNPRVQDEQRRREIDAELNRTFGITVDSTTKVRADILKLGQGVPEAYTLTKAIVAPLDAKLNVLRASFSNKGITDIELGDRQKALDDFKVFATGFNDGIEEALKPVHEARAKHQRMLADTAKAQQEAQADQFAKSMDGRGVLQYLKIERHCLLRLNKHGQIEIAPADMATDMRVRALIRMHCNDLRTILKARQDFATVDCEGFFSDEADQ